jgi:chromosome segregation ATPase
MGGNGSPMIFQDMINIAQRAQKLWESEISEAQQKLSHSKKRIEQLEEENAQYRSKAQNLIEELGVERKRADVLLKSEASLSELLKSREKDLDEERQKNQTCEEKLIRTKKLYDQISSQMINLKQKIASSRTRLHNRGELEDYDSRINQLLASVGSATGRLHLDRGRSVQTEKENFGIDQIELNVSSESRCIMKPKSKVCISSKKLQQMSHAISESSSRELGCLH